MNQQKEKNLFVTFFGDGDLCENLIKTMAYPDGYSYFRAFRYRDKWVQDKFLGNLQELKGKEAILSVRFTNEDQKQLVLPLRKITIEHVQCHTENLVYFRMGKMVNYANQKNLRDICLEIPNAVMHTKLLFEGEIKLENLEFTDGSIDTENESWASFCDKIGSDDSISISDEAKSSLFVRFAYLCGDDYLIPELIGKSKSEGPKYGAKFIEGKRYEIIVSHRLPKLIGTKNALHNLLVNYKVPDSKNVELNKVSDEYSANYNDNILAVTAARMTSYYEELLVSPQEREINFPDGKKVITHNFILPYKVNISRWYRFKKSGLWIILLLISWTIMAIWEPIFNLCYPEGDPPAWATIVFNFLPALGTLGVFYGKDKL